MIAGFVYVLSNPAMPGLLKIGKSDVSAEQRAFQLYTSGVPAPFSVEYSVSTENPSLLERMVHANLHEHRVSPCREFFSVSAGDAVAAIEAASDSEEFRESLGRENLDSKLIDAAGVTTKVASVCDVAATTVSLWRKVGIPSKRVAELHDYLSRQQEEAA